MINQLHRLFRSAAPGFQRVSSQQPPPPKRSGTAGFKIMLALAAGLLLSAVGAQASHFRGASLTWKRLASPANTVEITVTESWRINSGGANTYNFGDNTSFSTSGAPIIATGADFSILRKVVTHTYASEGPWTISTSGGNRISNLVNAANGAWNLQAVVDLRSANQG